MELKPILRNDIRIKRHRKNNQNFFSLIIPSDFNVFLFDEKEYFFFKCLTELKDLVDSSIEFYKAYPEEKESNFVVEFVNFLRKAGLLERGDIASKIIETLKKKNISYRTGEGDRRKRTEMHRDLERRKVGDRRYHIHPASIFEAGIFCLNNGDVVQSLKYFYSLRNSGEIDHRGNEIIDVIEQVLQEESDKRRLIEFRSDIPADILKYLEVPQPKNLRRMKEGGHAIEKEEEGIEELDFFEEFDEILMKFISEGKCPGCHENMVIELGSRNECPFCGCSFSTYVISSNEGNQPFE